MHRKFIYIVFFSLLTCLVLQADICSQTIEGTSTNHLARFQSDNGEFSLEMPADSEYFYDKDGFFFETPGRGFFRFMDMQMLNGVSGRTYMSVEIYRVTNPKAYINELLLQSGFAVKKIETGIKGITVQTAVLGPRSQGVLKTTGRTANYQAVYAASKTHIFIATVWNRGDANSISKAFLSSIRFGSNDAIKEASTVGSLKPVFISSLNPLTIREIAGQMSKDESRNVRENSEIDPKDPNSIFFLSSPWAGNIMATNNMLAKGKVALKVTYGSDARVKKVLHMSGLGGNSSRNAFFAILRTKFLPQELDGVALSTDRKIIYEF